MRAKATANGNKLVLQLTCIISYFKFYKENKDK